MNAHIMQDWWQFLWSRTL